MQFLKQFQLRCCLIWLHKFFSPQLICCSQNPSFHMASRLFKKITVCNPFTHYRKYCILPISTIFVEGDLNYSGRLQAAWSYSHEFERERLAKFGLENDQALLGREITTSLRYDVRPLLQ